MWASKGKGNYKPSMIDFQNYDYGDAPLSPMYKPFFDVSEMSDWNLAHVNAYKLKIIIDDENMAQIDVQGDETTDNMGWFFDNFTATGYHKQIKDYENNNDNSRTIDTIVELNEDGKSLHRFNSHNDDLEKVMAQPTQVGKIMRDFLRTGNIREGVFQNCTNEW